MIRPTLLAVLILVACDDSRAGEIFHKHRGTPPPGRPRVIPHTFERAGSPNVISTHAAPSRTPAYTGYYVGGGSAYGGDARRREEGTWGWDYAGIHLPRNVALGWNHGRRYQGGTGSYTTDRITSADSLGFVINGIRGRRRPDSSER